MDAAQIAQKLRCEMRDAWINLLLGQIVRDHKNGGVAASLSRQAFAQYMPPNAARMTDDERADAIAENEARTFERFLKSGYRTMPVKDDEIEFVVETYSQAYIGYKFLFDITRTNQVGAGIDIASVVSRGAWTTAVGGSVTDKRQATREFVLADRVDELLTNRPTIRVCNIYRNGGRPPNALYPIAGKLDLQSVVRSFIAANQSGNLIGQFADAQLLTSADTPPAPSMSETVIFSTTLHGGINPKLELTPRTSGTSVKGAEINLSGDRVDIHKLILVMQLPARDMTIAELRNKREAAVRDKRVTAIASELRRLEDRDENSRVLNILTGD